MELFSIQIKLGINLNAKQLGLRCFLTGLPQDRISEQPDVGDVHSRFSPTLHA